MQGHDTDRVKFDNRDYSITCHECGQTFEATRSDASFCSARCRVRYSQRPVKLANAIEEIRFMRIRVGEIASKYPSNKQVEGALAMLELMVQSALRDMDTGD